MVSGTLILIQKRSLIDSLKEDIQAGDKILFKGSRGMAMEKVIEEFLIYNAI